VQSGIATGWASAGLVASKAAMRVRQNIPDATMC
jgi:hypothetical protein